MAWQETKGDWSQREQRRNVILTDNHGRRWFAVVERKTGDEITMQPHGWEAPLIPPRAYIEPHPSEEQPLRRVINYERWKDDIRNALAEWETRGRTVARQTPGLGQSADGAFAPAILDVIGPRPMDIEPVLAAQQGNGYVLGTRPFDAARAADRALQVYFVAREEEVRVRAEPDFRDEDDDLLESAGDWDELEDAHDPDALGGKVVRAGSAGPGKRPPATGRHPTNQALGVRRSSASAAGSIPLEAGPVGPAKAGKAPAKTPATAPTPAPARSHKKKPTPAVAGDVPPEGPPQVLPTVG